MPREGVTQSQVEEAMEALEALGQSASYRRIRAVLGEGSLSTIATHKKAIDRQRQLDVLPPDSDRPPLPDPVTKALFAGAETSWQELLAAAEGYIAEAEKAAEERVADAKLAAEQALAQRDDAEADNLKLSQDLARSESTLNTLQKTHETLKENHQDLETQLASELSRMDELKQRNQDRQDHIEQLNVAVKNAERHAALAQEQLVATEQRFERDRTVLEKQRDHAQRRVEDLQGQLSSTRTELAGMMSQLSAKAEAYGLVQSQLSQAQDRLDDLKQERDQFLQRLAQLEATHASLQADLEQAQAQSTTLLAEKDKRLEEKDRLLAENDQRLEEQTVLIRALKAEHDRAQSSPPAGT